MTGGPPSPGDIVLGCLAVLVGCALATWSVTAARASRNPLYYICAVGAAIFVVGVAGQRIHPDAVQQAAEQEGRTPSGPSLWQAGIDLPFTLRLTGISAIGFVIGAVGVSLVLFFERAPLEEVGEEKPTSPLQMSTSIDDPDTV